MTHDRTVDPREVAFYSEMAATWWDRQGPFWPLHTLNELRISYIREQLCRHFDLDAAKDAPLSGLRVLDVGCGGGILAESMAKLGADVTGIDVVEKNIQIARLHAGESGLDIDYRVLPASALAADGYKFDVVLNMEVVEHVADLDAFMRDCNELVEDGGATVVATINRTWLAWLFAIVGAEYILRWLPRGTHRWSMFRTPREVADLLGAAQISVVDTVGVAANPFTRTLRQVRSTQVNYMMFCTRSRADR
ncbi:MAG: bifunctional 2-polyprenyl-6-hydroxyphenol methylase/3-demethylubiquinol 3-O-methyltransferase UbiG [Woeseiaceae bacterium]|nr:bifunctional 2-polyprenyl-6-hydroxyphenol methylase/3-demethylubiquinol 3-O-methyltransferase UbiG [Woeseiaceae bacterium]